MLIDFGRQQKLAGIVSHQPSVSELHDGKAVIKGLECAFLSFTSQHMTKHEDRLPLPFDPEVLERALGTGRAREPTG